MIRYLLHSLYISKNDNSTYSVCFIDFVRSDRIIDIVNILYEHYTNNRYQCHTIDNEKISFTKYVDNFFSNNFNKYTDVLKNYYIPYIDAQLEKCGKVCGIHHISKNHILAYILYETPHVN